MAIGEWYAHKTEQCTRLASEAADRPMRAKFQEEAKLWREIAHDFAKREAENPPH